MVHIGAWRMAAIKSKRVWEFTSKTLGLIILGKINSGVHTLYCEEVVLIYRYV
jgi:hypothetical protein